MGQATIFAGSKIKTLKSTLNLNGGADIISSSVDPTATATDGAPGSLLLNTTSGKLYRKNDSGSSTNWEIVGSGAGGINYVTNPDAESNTTGWSTYADAAGAQPVDGAGGSPNITWTRSTTSPLRGVADFVLTKDAVNRQGQGVATDLLINLADQAKQLVISLNYEILSGTYADGDIGVYIIADPAGTPVVIQPAGFQVQSLGSGTKGRLVATFQTLATGQSYRLCLHVASTSAAAYSLAVDTVQVGPQNVTFSTPVTDWVSYTPVWSSSGTQPSIGNGSIAGRWRRLGDSLEIDVRLQAGSTTTVGTGDYSFSIPSGLSIDTSKIAGTAATYNTVFLSAATHRRPGISADTGVVTYATPTTVQIFGDQETAVWGASIPASIGTTGLIHFNAVMPVVGWSSSAQVVSDSSEGRVVAATYSGSVSASNATSSFPSNITASRDTVGAVTSTGYRARVPGFYTFTGYVVFNTSNTAFRGVDVRTNGGSAVRIAGNNGTSSTATTVPYSITQFLAANDLFEIGGFQNTGGAETVNVVASVTMAQGSQTLLGGETVAARYQRSTSQSIANNDSTTQIMNFDTRVFDTHGAVTTGASWRFTAPVSGIYQVSATTSSATGGGWAAGEEWTNLLYVNGTLDVRIGSLFSQATHAQIMSANGMTSVRLLAGQYIDVRVYQNSGAALNTAADATLNHIEITRVGNY